jgi:hypothetical protein
MRVKVKSPNEAVFAAARSIASEEGNIVLENPKRLTLSLDDPPETVVQRLQAAGATVSPDYQYQIDAPE